MITKENNRICKNFQEENMKTLSLILKDNSNTEYGKLYNFLNIKNYEEYKNSIPLCEYSDFKKYINLMYKGEKNILTKYDVISYCKTSGTTNDPKIIPVTGKAIERYSYDFDINKQKILKEYRTKNGVGKRLFAHIFSVDRNDSFDKCEVISEIFYLNMYKKGKLIEDEHVGGFDLLFDSETKDVFYAKLWAALLEENIIIIEDIFMSKIILFLNYFEKNYKNIISDILNKSIPQDKIISQKVKNKLLSLPIDRRRLEFILEECNKGFNNIVKRIWPKIQIINGITTKTSFHEKKILDKYCGNIPRENFTYAMSEAYIGYSEFPNSFEYTFYHKGAFFEIISYKDDKGNKLEEKVYLLSEAKPGYFYQLVLTNFSGFYRYKTGDIIKITGINESKITFEFIKRINLELNIIEERVEIGELESVMKKIENKIPNILQYSFGANYNGFQGIYYLFLALNGERKNVNENDIAKIMDEILCKINYFYNSERKSNNLGMPKVFINNLEEYLKIIDSCGKNKRRDKTINILPIDKLDEVLKKGIIKF